MYYIDHLLEILYLQLLHLVQFVIESKFSGTGDNFGEGGDVRGGIDMGDGV